MASSYISPEATITLIVRLVSKLVEEINCEERNLEALELEVRDRRETVRRARAMIEELRSAGFGDEEDEGEGW